MTGGKKACDPNGSCSDAFLSTSFRPPLACPSEPFLSLPTADGFEAEATPNGSNDRKVLNLDVDGVALIELLLELCVKNGEEMESDEREPELEGVGVWPMDAMVDLV